MEDELTTASKKLKALKEEEKVRKASSIRLVHIILPKHLLYGHIGLYCQVQESSCNKSCTISNLIKFTCYDTCRCYTW